MNSLAQFARAKMEEIAAANLVRVLKPTLRGPQAGGGLAIIRNGRRLI